MHIHILGLCEDWKASVKASFDEVGVRVIAAGNSGRRSGRRVGVWAGQVAPLAGVGEWASKRSRVQEARKPCRAGSRAEQAARPSRQPEPRGIEAVGGPASESRAASEVAVDLKKAMWDKAGPPPATSLLAAPSRQPAKTHLQADQPGSSSTRIPGRTRLVHGCSADARDRIWPPLCRRMPLIHSSMPLRVTVWDRLTAGRPRLLARPARWPVCRPTLTVLPPPTLQPSCHAVRFCVAVLLPVPVPRVSTGAVGPDGDGVDGSQSRR